MQKSPKSRPKCEGITQKGKRCSRNATTALFCAQHAGTPDELTAPMTRVCVNHTKVKVSSDGKEAVIGPTDRTCLDVPSQLINSGMFDTASFSNSFSQLQIHPT